MSDDILQIPSKSPPATTKAAAAVFLAPAPPVLAVELPLPLAVSVTPTVAVEITVSFPAPTFVVYVTWYFVAASLTLLEYSVSGLRLTVVAQEDWVVVIIALFGMRAPTQQ